MTPDDMCAAFQAHTSGQTKFTRRMAIVIGDHFGMHPMQVVKYYERMGLLKTGSVEWFRDNGGFSKENFAEARADNNWIKEVFKPLPEAEAKLLRDYGP